MVQSEQSVKHSFIFSDCSKVPGNMHTSSSGSTTSGSKHSKGASNSTTGTSSSGNSAGKKTTVGSASNYSKRSSSRGKSPPVVSAAISNAAGIPASNANTNISSSGNQPLANKSSPGSSQKVVSANPSGAVQINSSS